LSWILDHKLILVVYLSGLMLAAFELNLPQDRSDYLADPEAFLNPEINIADVSSSLYPDRALSLYYRAYQASLCFGPEDSTPPECRQRDRVEPGQVRELIERSLATGNRSIEMAMYNYAMVLLMENASSEKIDAAIYNWRVSYPGSSQADPREAYQRLLRQ